MITFTISTIILFAIQVVLFHPFTYTKKHQNGWCGEKELVKLEAYTLTQHPIVVIAPIIQGRG